MANPQAENGHVDIANEIIEALAGIRLSGEEVQCLWVIIRKTYGWKKLEDKISLSQFAVMTGIKKQHVSRALIKLSSKMVIAITKNGDSQINSYKFIKDFDKWKPSPKKATLSPILVKGVPNIGKGVSPKMVNTKDTITKDTITKERHGEFKNVLLTPEELIKLKEKFWDGLSDKIEALGLWKESKGKKTKSDYATILSWARREPKPTPKQKEIDIERERVIETLRKTNTRRDSGIPSQPDTKIT
jgi:phage replication O-like protein O